MASSNGKPSGPSVLQLPLRRDGDARKNANCRDDWTGERLR